MKKLFALLLVVFMLSSVATGYAQSFLDVPDTHWAHDAISYFSDDGTIIGVGNNLFEPDELISREEFAKLISEIYGKTNNDISQQTFTDVTADMWSYKYIESVKDYLTGYYTASGSAFFNPQGNAAREDVAYALVKIIGLDKTQTCNMDILNKYEDSNEISYHLKNYVALAVSCGLMQGYENYLRPQDGITRAETAALLFRAIKKPVAEDTEEIIPPADINENIPPAETNSDTIQKPDNTEKLGNTEIPDVSKDKNNSENQPDKEEVTDNTTGDQIKYEIADNSISTESIYYTKCTAVKGEEFNITNTKDIKGYVQITFGKDAIKDTRIVTEFTINGDRYYAESTEITYYSYAERGKTIRIRFDSDIYKNGKLFTNHACRNITINRENDALDIGGKVTISAEKLDWNVDSLPPIPDEQPPLYEDTTWDGANFVMSTIKEFNGETASGALDIHYKKTEGIAKASAIIIVGETEYKAELAELTSINDEEITGSFKLWQNGQSIAQNVSGQIKNYKGQLMDKIQFVCDNTEWNYEASIVEIGK